MKKHVFVLVTAALCFVGNILKSQTERLTTGGYFETVFDQDGNSHNITDLMVKLNYSSGIVNVASSNTCSSGFFDIYFDNNSGMAGTSTLSLARRATICELAGNISGLLGYNSNWPSNTRVKLLIGDINNYLQSASSSSVLGLGTAIFATPLNPFNPNPGIEQTLMQKTIISKTDAWTNVVAPLNMAGSSGFYHGIISFNFANTSFSWHSDHMTTSGSLYDLYTVGLHEMMHVLGFASLISSTGVSKFGAANNYYTTYDQFLENASGNNLITTSHTCSSQYGHAFTGGTLNLAPGSYTSDVTTCSVACAYTSPNLHQMPVYTPGVFDGGGGTLSHFEDMCYPTNTPTNNNQYFVMSNGTPPGLTKRYPKNEERLVLCDLGYSVMTVYTSSAASASHTYTGASACVSNSVFGVNDGFNGTTLTFTSTGAGSTVTISISSLSLNDSQGSTPSCIETVYNNGTVSVSGSTITFSPAANYTGPFLLRYIPIDNSSSIQGNITYVFGYVYPGQCSPVSPCDIVQNGGFETNNNCGPILPGGTVQASCWFPFTVSPDLFVRSCTPSVTLPANLGVNTYSSTSTLSVNAPFDCHSPSVTASGTNNAVMGFYSEVFPSGLGLSESAGNFLGTPLLNNQTYVLSFWAFRFDGNMYFESFVPPSISQFSVGNTSIPLVLNFGTSSQFAITNQVTYPVTFLVNTATTVTLSTIPNAWVHYSVTFTYTNTANGNILYVGADNVGTTANYYSFGGLNMANVRMYTLIDDVSIKPLGQAVTFILPNNQLCTSQGYTNLAQYTSIPGGTFSGVGTSTTSGANGPEYHFNASGTLTAGVYNIAYTYTNSPNCTQTIYQQVTLDNSSNTATLSYTPAAPCSLNGTLTVVSPTAGLSYTWQPNSVNSYTAAVSPSVVTAYTAAAAISSVCNITGTIIVQPNVPTPTLSSIYNANCWGATLTAIGNFTAINWTPGNFTTNPVIVSPSIATSYTATITNSLGCSGGQVIVVNPVTPSTVSILNNEMPCMGGQSTLTANNNLAFNNTLFATWSPGNITGTTVVVSPTANTVYTATLSNIFGCITTATTLVHSVSLSIVAQSATNSACFPTTYTLTAGGATSATWQPGGSTSLSITVSPTVTTTYTLVSSADGCTQTNTLTLGPATLNVNNPPDHCINDVIPTVISATLMNSNWATYTWQPGNLVGQTQSVSPTATTIYTVYASLGSCVSTQVLTVTAIGNCCPTSTVNTSSSPVWAGGTYTVPYNILSSFTVTSPNVLNINSTEFSFASDVKITVQGGATLNINGSHLRACGTRLWEGIEVLPGGRLNMQPFSGLDNLIEDAKIAVAISNPTATSTVLDIDNTVFNKNYIGVKISGYSLTVSPYPFFIENSVFTSRTFSTSASLSWPQGGTVSVSALKTAGVSTPTTGLSSPYPINNYSVSYLKLPYSAQTSSTAIWMENIGASTNNGILTTYTGVTVGDISTVSDFNLFDNHAIFIRSTNSNVFSHNNVFQNTVITPSVNSDRSGSAIFTEVNTLLNNILNMNTNSPVGHDRANRFWNCHRGINAVNTFSINASFAFFRSTQTTANGITPFLPGALGVRAVTNRVGGYWIHACEFNNINNPVNVSLIPGSFNVTGTLTTGLYIGDLFVHNSYMGASLNNTISLTGQFLNKAVELGSVLSSSTTTVSAGVTGINTDGNLIDRAYNGITYTGIQHFTCQVGSNTVTLGGSPTTPTASAISFLNCTYASARTNTLSAASMTNTNQKLFLVENSPATSVRCNDLSNCYQGFVFRFVNGNSVWRGNKMEDLDRALALYTAAIGAQGTTTAASDNAWNGTWSGYSQTYVDQSDAQLSKLYVKSGSPWVPTFNSGHANTSPALWYSASGNLPIATGTYACESGGIGWVRDDGFPVPTHVNYGSANLYAFNTVAYRYLVKNDSVLDDGGELSIYCADLSATSIETFRQVEELLFTGDIEGARTLNESVSAENEVEINYQDFYDLYADYAEGVFDSSDSTALFDLAQLCPLENGACVYQARALYNAIYIYLGRYNDEACNGTGARMPGQQSSYEEHYRSKIGDSDWKIDIYPNPASNRLIINSNKLIESLTLEILDVSGRNIIHKTIHTKEFVTILEIDLPNGLYFFKLEDEFNQRVAKKLVIAK